MPQPHVLALSSGRRAVPSGGGRPTAIDKRPVDMFEARDPGPKRGGLGSGVVGDEIGNPKHHGGELQAVHARRVVEADVVHPGVHAGLVDTLSRRGG